MYIYIHTYKLTSRDYVPLGNSRIGSIARLSDGSGDSATQVKIPAMRHHRRIAMLHHVERVGPESGYL